MESLRFYLFILLCYYLSSKALQYYTLTMNDNIIPPPSVGAYSIESGALSTRIVSEDINSTWKSKQVVVAKKQTQE